MPKKKVFRQSKNAILSPILNKQQCIQRKHKDFAMIHIGNGHYVCGNKKCGIILPKYIQENIIERAYNKPMILFEEE